MPTPSSYVLIPGAGGQAWYWHRLVAELRRRGEDPLAVDLPTGDDRAGLDEYVDAVVAAVGNRTDLVLVAQSMAGFTAPLVCERRPVRLLVLLNAMVPRPGETAGEWWDNTGHRAARAAAAARDGRTGDESTIFEDFFHDVPADVRAAAIERGEPPQSGTPFGQPWPAAGWPDVPTRFLQGRDDRIFPIEFQRQVAAERLGLEVDEMPGGHLLALSRPHELADRLEAYRTQLVGAGF